MTKQIEQSKATVVEMCTVAPKGYTPWDVGVAFYRALYKLRVHPDISDEDKELFKQTLVFVTDRTAVKLVGKEPEKERSRNA